MPQLFDDLPIPRSAGIDCANAEEGLVIPAQLLHADFYCHHNLQKNTQLFVHHPPVGPCLPCSRFFLRRSFSRRLRSSAFSLDVSRLPVSPLTLGIFAPALNMPLFCIS